MGLKAYGFNLQDTDHITISQMIKNVTTKPVEIYDLRSYELDIKEEDIVLLYGHRACKAANGQKCLYSICFPDISQLDEGFGDEEEIKLAQEKLEQLKNALASGILEELTKIKHSKQETTHNTTSEESLPDINSSQVLQLESTLKKKGVMEWLGNSKDGKSFRITIEPQDSPADINLTFAELYGLKMAMETLRAEELEIVYKPSGHNRQNNS